MIWMLAVAAVAQPVNLDGNLDPAEWQSSASIGMGEGYKLLVRADGPDVALAVQYPRPAVTSVDLFVETPSGSRDLHASARIGQRVHSPEGWSEWLWEQHSGWDGHVTARDPVTRRYVAQSGREFRISRSLLPAGAMRIRVVVSADTRLTWPARSSEEAPATWQTVPIPAAPR